MSKQLKLPSRLDVRRALTTPPPVPDHVLPGLPTGAVGALVAPGSTGKTMFLLQLCINLAAGMPAVGGILSGEARRSARLAPAKVVLAVAEETLDEMHRRLHAAVSHIISSSHPLLDQHRRDQVLELLDANLHVYALAGSTRMLIDGRDTQGDGLQALAQMSTGARLVVIDPMRQFHTGNENDSWAMTSVVQALQSIASAGPCAVLAAHHTNKQSTLSGSGDQAGASRGSAAFTDGVRWQLNLSQLDEALASQYRIAVGERRGYLRADLAKANYIAPQPPQVLRREAGGVLSLVRMPTGGQGGRK